MKNHINKNIKTEIRWSREIVRKSSKNPKGYGRINGLYILDKKLRGITSPNGFCGSIGLNSDGSMEIFTNGKYQFIKKKIAIELLKELSKLTPLK